MRQCRPASHGKSKGSILNTGSMDSKRPVYASAFPKPRDRRVKQVWCFASGNQEDGCSRELRMRPRGTGRSYLLARGCKNANVLVCPRAFKMTVGGVIPFPCAAERETDTEYAVLTAPYYVRSIRSSLLDSAWVKGCPSRQAGQSAAMHKLHAW